MGELESALAAYLALRFVPTDFVFYSMHPVAPYLRFFPIFLGPPRIDRRWRKALNDEWDEMDWDFRLNQPAFRVLAQT